jgi:hypothetical protein
VNNETSKSHHQAARQIQIDGLTRMHARVIRAGEFSKDELIQLLAQARATLELERKESAGMVSLLPKVAVAVQKTLVQGKGGDATADKFEAVRLFCIDEWHKTKHLYPWGVGFSKKRFSEAICNDPRLVKLSGLRGGLNPDKISKDYLKGIN